jgi:hypothetical protein
MVRSIVSLNCKPLLISNKPLLKGQGWGQVRVGVRVKIRVRVRVVRLGLGMCGGSD